MDPGSQPQPIQERVGDALILGTASSGALVYGLDATQNDIFVADLADPEAKPAVVRTGAPGRATAPAFSPDGASIAFVADLKTVNYGQRNRTIVVRSLESGEERELAARLAHVERLSWSPDSNRLLVAGSDRRSRGGLFEVELSSGRLRSVVIDDAATFLGLEGGYSADGASVYFGGPSVTRQSLADQMQEQIFVPDGSLVGVVPAESPDGSALGMLVRRKLGGDVYMIDGGASPEKVLTLPNGSLETLDWLPDSSALLVGTRGMTGAMLWRVSREGDDLQRVKLAPRRAGGVSVHPDGRRIVYAVETGSKEVWLLTSGMGSPSSHQ